MIQALPKTGDCWHSSAEGDTHPDRMAAERNLIFVHTPVKQGLSDFTAMRALIADRAPEIDVFIVTNGQRQSVTRRKASARPSLVFSPLPIRDFRPIRGKVYQGVLHTKAQECERLAAAGINTPRSIVVEPRTQLDPDEWGQFTVLKPLQGNQGKGIRLTRTQDVRWVDPRSRPRNDPRFGRPIVAQRFIDTGVCAQSHRVMTVFSRPVYAITTRSLVQRPPLDPRQPTDIPIAANAGGEDGRVLEMNHEAEIIDFARVASGAFPEIPVLGVDIIREEATGQLFVTEVNAGGGTWHISSAYAEPYRRKFGLDLYGQFGALDVIADALIDVTRREAA